MFYKSYCLAKSRMGKSNRNTPWLFLVCHWSSGVTAASGLVFGFHGRSGRASPNHQCPRFAPRGLGLDIPAFPASSLILFLREYKHARENDDLSNQSHRRYRLSLGIRRGQPLPSNAGRKDCEKSSQISISGASSTNSFCHLIVSAIRSPPSEEQEAPSPAQEAIGASPPIGKARRCRGELQGMERRYSQSRCHCRFSSQEGKDGNFVGRQKH